MGFLQRLFGGGDPGSPRRLPDALEKLPARPARFGIDELARRLGVSEADLRATPREYTTFSIPKRSGKPRQIAAPNEQLKQLQRLILRRLLSRLRAHPAVTGFERGHSIATNAKFHTGRALVVRMDIKDFFPSTTAAAIRQFFARLGWDAAAADLLTQWCTHEGRLPQGAPTSPRLSTLVNYPMDVRLQAVTDRFAARYTRYADDLTFSFADDDQHAVHSLVNMAKWVVEEFDYQLHMKHKLHIRRQYQRQVVTGLVVNQRAALPREKRRWLRAVEHRMSKGKRTTLTPAQVAGWHALQRMIESQVAGGGTAE